LVGAWVVKLHDPGWFLSVGLTTIVCLVLWLGFRWMVWPVESLIRLMEGLAHSPQTIGPHQLPLTRRDELGQMARLMHQVYITAQRDRTEIGRLRKTLDDRIAQATRMATKALTQMAMRDPLTDLGNRRFLSANFPPLLQSCQAAGDDLHALLIDLDNFKQVNDTLGHSTGDELLVFLASLIRASVRAEDYTVRLGGDEFLVLMPACPAERVTNFARQLRVLFHQHVKTALPPELKADLSIGIASLIADRPASPQELIAKADERLYAAKRAGKGCAISA
ncbi:MAG: diguanylate cyclase, partial [Phycisphaeraceae bacterium]|nr:diguanylate cyclase [Phycisphaeraceae bacterium]